jgi:hypothetical protein
MSPTTEQRLHAYRTVLDEAAARLGSGATTRTPDDDHIVRLTPTPPRKRGVAVAAVAVALIVGAVGVVAWHISTDESETPTTQPDVTRPPATRPPTTTPATRPPARGVAPFLLIDGWTATALDTFDPWDGVDREDVRAATFELGDRAIRVYWSAGNPDERFVPALPADAEGRATTHSVLGQTAEVSRTIDHHGAFFTARWTDGDVDLEVTTQGSPIGTLDEFKEALDGLRSVSFEAFEEAFPTGDRSPVSAPGTAPVSGTPTRDLPPFLLFDGWNLVEISEHDAWDGTSPDTPREAAYEMGDQRMEVFWYAYDNHVDKLRDRVDSAYGVTRHDVLGHRAQIAYGSPEVGQLSAIWTDGIVTLEVRTEDFDTLAAFTRTLYAVRSVERAEFDAALPPASAD